MRQTDCLLSCRCHRLGIINNTILLRSVHNSHLCVSSNNQIKEVEASIPFPFPWFVWKEDVLASNVNIHLHLRAQSVPSASLDIKSLNSV